MNKTTPAIRGTSPTIERLAREMRRQMTPAEAALWAALRNKQLDGLRFRAQHPVARFILDFYCPSAKLVVELDGDIHDLTRERDAERSAHLSAHGLKVIRIPNEAVLNDLPAVLDQIRIHANPPAPEQDDIGAQ